jgi:hypothetical protein
MTWPGMESNVIIVILTAGKNLSVAHCHSDRREESRCLLGESSEYSEMLHFVQHDKELRCQVFGSLSMTKSFAARPLSSR